MAAATSVAAPKLLRHFSTSTFTSGSPFSIHIPNCFSSTRAKWSFPIRAHRQQQPQNDTSGRTGFNFQEDSEYLGRLLAGSIVGGAVIKYGSIVFPEITRPNFILALIMIFTPVIIATLLLIKESRAKG